MMFPTPGTVEGEHAGNAVARRRKGNGCDNLTKDIPGRTGGLRRAGRNAGEAGYSGGHGRSDR